MNPEEYNRGGSTQPQSVDSLQGGQGASVPLNTENSSSQASPVIQQAPQEGIMVASSTGGVFFLSKGKWLGVSLGFLVLILTGVVIYFVATNSDKSQTKKQPAVGSQISQKGDGPVVVEDYAWRKSGDFLMVAVEVRNKDKSKVARDIRLLSVLKGKDGKVISEDWELVQYVRPGEKRVLGLLLDNDSGTEVEKVELTVDTSENEIYDLVEASTIPELQLEPLVATVLTNPPAPNNSGGFYVQVEVKNPTNVFLQSAYLDIIVRDSKGKLKWGSFSFANLIPAGGSTVDTRDYDGAWVSGDTLEVMPSYVLKY